MLIFDQLKKDDPQLRLLAVLVFAGLMTLLVRLWWVQVVSTQNYRDKLEVQSVRTVRIPAVRGRILDREGRVLAENEPCYNINLYLEELSRDFQAATSNTMAQVKRYMNERAAAREKELGRKLTPAERNQYVINAPLRDQINRQVRYEVTSNLVADLGARLNLPTVLPEKVFETHYEKSRALPLTIVSNLSPELLARFEEQSLHTPAMELEIQSLRRYPYTNLAAHVLGYLVQSNDSVEGEVSDYNYRLKDFAGVTGIENVCDTELRGQAGEKSMLVNNFGYKQGETVTTPSEPGQDVVLTIDANVQAAAERALALHAPAGPNVHGAVVVLDVRTGDILAMASAPSYNPNHFIQRPSPEIWAQEMERWTNADSQVQLNHAMQGAYAPGSIFKIITGLAALEEHQVTPEEVMHSPGYYPMPGHALGKIGDLAGAGDFDFDRALAKSCNYYFITCGLRQNVLPEMITLGERLHLGERTGLMPRQEDRGHMPTRKDVTARTWRDGDTANLSIGQGALAVTPLQAAVLIAAIANGGNVLYPHLIARTEPYGSPFAELVSQGQVRDNLGVNQINLHTIYKAMEDDVSGPEGTGKEARIKDYRIAGKTGTAQVMKNGHVDKALQNTWFGSFAPVDSPKYAVVAMVVSGASGGGTCAPIAHDIYMALMERERRLAAKNGTLAEMHN